MLPQIFVRGPRLCFISGKQCLKNTLKVSRFFNIKDTVISQKSLAKK